MSKEWVADILAKVITRYDIILIQEIRDASQTAIFELLNLVNQQSAQKYKIILSDRLGRTRSKEQYAYFYKPSVINLLSSYHYEDGPEPDNDTFQREPFLVRFRTLTGQLDFSIIGIHTAPGEAVREIDHLFDVYTDMVVHWNDRDVLIMGDFNADCNYLDQDDQDKISLWQNSDFIWWIGDETDTTTTNTDCAYDRIVSNFELKDSIIPNSAGVFRMDLEFGLSSEQTQAISDHYPVEIRIRL